MQAAINVRFRLSPEKIYGYSCDMINWVAAVQ
jgi:hypothetical protein